MSSESRARRFDGFDRPSAGAASVPESGLDRILEAFTRCRHYLPETTANKLSELWDRDTALCFALLLAVWAGLQFTPAGWLADLLIAAYGFASLAGDLVGLVGAGQQAAIAETDRDLEAAAELMAHAITDTVADVLAGLVGGVVFARMRKLVRLARAKLLPRRFAGRAEKALTLGDRVVGAGAGVAAEAGAPALGQKKKELDRIGWGVLVGGSILLVGGLVAISSRGETA